MKDECDDKRVVSGNRERKRGELKGKKKEQAVPNQTRL